MPPGVLPAMSRIELLPVPIRVSWYRPLASAAVVKLSVSAPNPPVPGADPLAR